MQFGIAKYGIVEHGAGFEPARLGFAGPCLSSLATRARTLPQHKPQPQSSYHEQARDLVYRVHFTHPLDFASGWLMSGRE